MIKAFFQKYFIDHCQATDQPQTYWQHLWFAWSNCGRLQIALIAGFIHGVFPQAFPFYTARKIIESFKRLADSRRHVQDFKDIIPEGYLQEQHLTANAKKKVRRKKK